MRWVLRLTELTDRGKRRLTSHLKPIVIEAFGRIHSVPTPHPSHENALARKFAEERQHPCQR